jgi:hypothetical protein
VATDSFHPILASLGAQFFREINLFGLLTDDLDLRSEDERQNALAYLTIRGLTLAAILRRFESAGVRLEVGRFPFSLDEPLPGSNALAGYSSAEFGAVPPSLAAETLLSRWNAILRAEDASSMEFFLLFRSAAWMTANQGFGAGVDYVLDALEAGHVLQPYLAGRVIAALVVAAGQDLSREQFTAGLWADDAPSGDWWAVFPGTDWTSPAPATVHMAQLISAVLERCLAARAAVLVASTLDGWIINLNRFRCLVNAAGAAIPRALKKPSITTRATMSQLAELDADLMGLEGSGRSGRFAAAVDAQDQVCSELQGIAGIEEGLRRFHAERQLIPDALLRRPTPNAWYTPSWRIAVPLHAWDTPGGLSPFTPGGPTNYDYEVDADEQHVMERLRKIADETESRSDVLKDPLWTATRLIYDYPWCDIAYFRAAHCTYLRGAPVCTSAAIDYLVPALCLQPLQPAIWHSLAVYLDELGQKRSAHLVSEIAEYVDAETQLDDEHSNDVDDTNGEPPSAS